MDAAWQSQTVDTIRMDLWTVGSVKLKLIWVRLFQNDDKTQIKQKDTLVFQKK